MTIIKYIVEYSCVCFHSLQDGQVYKSLVKSAGCLDLQHTCNEYNIKMLIQTSYVSTLWHHNQQLECFFDNLWQLILSGGEFYLNFHSYIQISMLSANMIICMFIYIFIVFMHFHNIIYFFLPSKFLVHDIDGYYEVFMYILLYDGDLFLS